MHCVHEHELHARSAGSMHVMHAQEGSKHRPGAQSERGGIVCASRHPPRPLGGVGTWKIGGQEDLEDFWIEKLPRAALEATPRGFGGPELPPGATTVN